MLPTKNELWVREKGEEEANFFVAMKPQEVTEALQLSKLKDKVWYVVPSCATTGEGLLEGLAWLSNNVKAPPAPAKK